MTNLSLVRARFRPYNPRRAALPTSPRVYALCLNKFDTQGIDVLATAPATKDHRAVFDAIVASCHEHPEYFNGTIEVRLVNASSIVNKRIDQRAA